MLRGRTFLNTHQEPQSHVKYKSLVRYGVAGVPSGAGQGCEDNGKERVTVREQVTL